MIGPTVIVRKQLLVFFVHEECVLVVMDYFRLQAVGKSPSGS
jgi:hypothetical protein